MVRKQARDFGMNQGTTCERIGIDLQGGTAIPHQLVLAAQRGDAGAFQELIYDYDAMVMRVALALAGAQGKAQEIYCKVFSDAFASVNQLDAGSSVFIWLYRILVKHCVEYCRRSAREEDSAIPLARALRALPPTQRVVFQLKQFHGLKIRTLAEIFEAPPEFIVQTLQSAIDSLRTHLKTASGHPGLSASPDDETTIRVPRQT